MFQHKTAEVCLVLAICISCIAESSAYTLDEYEAAKIPLSYKDRFELSVSVLKGPSTDDAALAALTDIDWLAQPMSEMDSALEAIEAFQSAAAKDSKASQYAS